MCFMALWDAEDKWAPETRRLLILTSYPWLFPIPWRHSLYCPEDETYSSPKTVNLQPEAASSKMSCMTSTLTNPSTSYKKKQTKWTTTTKQKTIYFSFQWRCQCFGKKKSSNLTQLCLLVSSVGGGGTISMFPCIPHLTVGELDTGLIISPLVCKALFSFYWWRTKHNHSLKGAHYFLK